MHILTNASTNEELKNGHIQEWLKMYNYVHVPLGKLWFEVWTSLSIASSARKIEKHRMLIKV